MNEFNPRQLTINGKRPKPEDFLPTEENLYTHLSQKFVKFLKKSKERSLIQRINNYYGKNFPINYQESFKFNQKWQEKQGEYSHEQFLLEEQSGYYSSFSMIVLFINAFTLWALTTERYYQTDIVSLNTSYYNIQIGINILQILIKCMLLYQNEDGNKFVFKKIIKIISKNIMCFVYFLHLQLLRQGYSPVEYIVELFIYYLLWKNASQTFKNFKLKSFVLKYQNQLKIFELLLNIFIQAHIFSIMMICASKIDPDNNWIKSKGIEDLSIFQKYIYSFYFSCTTMLTIGYGDITPQTSNQILVILVIQIIGVVSFGYLLNEMGHTLSKMRQETQMLEKDLQTIGKMARYYHLEKMLETRAKKYIITNRKIVDQLRPDDQNRLLMKLNDQLRTQITNQNFLGIVKTSIFFLCHWSKGFQSSIARLLQKRLFSPNERLGNSQKIYIIRSGKINIYLNRFGSISQQGKKLLRIVTVSHQQTVSDNIYGYTSMFSNRPVYLQALAKQFTTTYSLSKEEFLRCMKLDHRDFEYFHQIKCRIDQSSFCQEWQAPAIKNIREHYIPSKIFLIRKYRAKITRETNKRRICFRRMKIKSRLINQLVICNAEDINSFNGPFTYSEKTLQFRQLRKSIQMQHESESSSDQPRDSSSQIQSNESKSIDMARQYIKTFKLVTALEENDNKKVISYLFEMRYDYTNFFPNNNFSTVMQKLQKENCFQRTFN